MQEVISPTPAQTPPPAPRRRMSRGLILALSGVLLGLLLLCAVGGMLICQTIEGGCSLPFAANTEPTPTPIPPQIPPVFSDSQIIIGEGAQAVQIPADPPTRLSTAGTDFAVQVSGVGADGRWNPTMGSEKVAVWLNGTMINYVLAVQDTEANRTLMQSLERGQLLTLTTNSGRQLEFDFSSREIVPNTKLDIFGQTSPGITVVLMRDDDATDRMIISGRYKVGETAQSINPAGGTVDGSQVAELGEVIQLGDLQLAVTAFDSRPVAGGNSSYFLVDYQIQNNGQIPIEAGVLQFTLVDSIGSQYVLSLEASQIGNFQPLPQSLGVGQPLQATAGYQVPNGLDPSSLGWIVKRLDTGEQIEVRASRAVAGEGNGAVSADISLDNASLVAEATSLLLQGSIANSGTTSLVIDEGDVVLESNGTAYLILSTNPRFPWLVAPGETISYSLTVQKPIDNSVATFSILDSSWQLDNFR